MSETSAKSPGLFTQEISVSNGPLECRSPKIVEIYISQDRKKLWVNIEGVCWLRVQAIKQLIIDQ